MFSRINLAFISVRGGISIKFIHFSPVCRNPSEQHRSPSLPRYWAEGDPQMSLRTARGQTLLGHVVEGWQAVLLLHLIQ